MLTGSTRKLDLYDFVSVLIPGIALLLALAPFLPVGTRPSLGEALIVLLVGGFITGRAIHSTAVYIEDQWEIIPTHRERFESELRNPRLLSERTVRQFCHECNAEFDAIEFSGETSLADLEEGTPEDLYVLVRSYIHMDSRGRSRTFQALYSFYRGMWITAFIIGMTYYWYALAESFGVIGELVSFTSYYGTLGISPVVTGLVSAGIPLFGHYVFREAREDFQGHFVQYLIADYLVLQGVDYPETMVTANPLDD